MNVVAALCYITAVSSIRVVANIKIMASSESWTISRITIYCICSVLLLNWKFLIDINWIQERLCIVLITSTWVPWNKSETTKYFITSWFNYCYCCTFIVTIRMKTLSWKTVSACSIQKRCLKILLRLFYERSKFLPVTLTLENYWILEIWSNQLVL